MSIEAMVAVMKLPPGSTTTSERLLLLAMAEIGDDDGEVSAFCRSQAYLAFKCGWRDAGSVRKILRSLERKGLLASREQGVGRSQSSYQLTFLETVSRDNLPKLFRKYQKSTECHSPATVETGPNGRDQSGPNGRDQSGPNGRDHIPVVPVNTPQEKPALARGLKKWFSVELWPRFPDPVDQTRAWREIELLNPGEELRSAIIAGLDRFIARWEREVSESTDGFVRALPTPRNWLRDRRWEDRA